MRVTMLQFWSGGGKYPECFGDDLFVFSSQEKAKQAALQIVKQRRSIWEIPKDLTDEQALEQWEFLTGGEGFLFHEVEVE